MLKKEFKRKDVQRARNLITGKTGASTGTNVDLYANNVGIETVADSILDFSEGNPFSEGSGY